MATELTGADALEFYHTGAVSHAAAQADPNLSLGGHQSSTKVVCVTATDTTPTLGSGALTIKRIAAKNGLGTGVITAAGSDDLTWTPPGGSAGATVTILNGETRMLPGNDPDKYIVVTRDNANAMTGTANVAIVDNYPNVFGFDDVPSSEQTAGDDEYRCVGIENLGSVAVQSITVRINTQGTQQVTNVTQLGASGAGTIEISGGDFDDWPASGFGMVKTTGGAVRELIYYTSRTSTVLTVPAAGRGLGVTTAAAGAATDTIDATAGVEIGLDAPDSQPSGLYVISADEDSAPAAITFTSPVVASEALSIGDLDPGEIYGIWLHRIVPAGQTNISAAVVELVLTADAA